jgi:hypothetical protein
VTFVTRAIGAWLVGVVLLALFGVGVATRNQPGGAHATLIALTAFTERPLGNPWTPHAADAHTAAGLRILADAISEAVPRQPAEAEAVRKFARAIDVAPPGAADADMAHDAFGRVSRVLSKLPADSAAAHAVRTAADNVSTTRPLCDQRDAVVTFFVRSRDLLATVQ